MASIKSVVLVCLAVVILCPSSQAKELTEVLSYERGLEETTLACVRDVSGEDCHCFCWGDLLEQCGCECKFRQGSEQDTDKMAAVIGECLDKKVGISDVSPYGRTRRGAFTLLKNYVSGAVKRGKITIEIEWGSVTIRISFEW